MRVLHVGAHRQAGQWLTDTMAGVSATEFDLEQVIGVAAAAARLRDEVFDALLISHEPVVLDAVELIEGLRASGCEDSLIVLGAASEAEMSRVCHQAGADVYLCLNTTTTATLLWTTARAVERHRLLRDNRRMLHAERQRLEQEHQEAERLLAEQRMLISDLESLGPRASQLATRGQPVSVALDLPANLVAHYRDLLRAYVIMGSGNLTAEMHPLAELLASAGVTARQTMLLHLQAIEELVRGLGNRSARHVMTRADLLVLEVMMHLAEGYRRRSLDQEPPPGQQWLPGFKTAQLAS